MDDELLQQGFYHGYIVEKEIKKLLRKNGDFMVRWTGIEDEIVITVFWNGNTLDYTPSQYDFDNLYRLGKVARETITGLVKEYYKTGEPVSVNSGAKLIHPIPRQAWELSHDQIKKTEEIGKGDFGVVCKGWLKLGRQKIEVAIKTCSGHPTRVQREKFMNEARIMRTYSHPNIVQMYGVAAQKHPLLLVMEFVRGGTLIGYLMKKKVSTEEKINFCLQAAKGMEYLASQGCIHRDLAARNCLLAKKNELKIADFGLSRDQDYYKMSPGVKRLPFRWMAPEALAKSIFTVKSDVWSFGILMWEIFSDGEKPYGRVDPMEVYEKVPGGYQLPCPEEARNCPRIEQIMKSCWELEPEKRPNFTHLKKEFERLAK